MGTVKRISIAPLKQKNVVRMKTEKFKIKNKWIDVVIPESITDDDWDMWESMYKQGYLKALTDMEEVMKQEYFWEIAPDVQDKIKGLRKMM